MKFLLTSVDLLGKPLAVCNARGVLTAICNLPGRRCLAPLR
jgi:hypothetical protein